MSILKIEELEKIYNKNKKEFKVVNNVDLQIGYGQCVGLVGESGCGKSTIAKLVTNIEKATKGKIVIEGNDITNFSKKQNKELYKTIQMIFQNPQDSFNPRMTLGESISEIMINYGSSKKGAKVEVYKLLDMVGLKEEYYDRFPSNVSGGECQRAAIARVLAIKPKIIICDEATSALDVSVQAQIIELLKRLKDELGLSYLFISHDLALVQSICDRIYVMKDGCIVEEGSRNEVINYPKNDYTKLLLGSVFEVEL